MWESIFVLVRISVLVYVGLILVLAGCQRGMIYYPTRASESDTSAMAAIDGLAPWRNADGVIIGWRPERPNAGKDRLLVFHGNAGFAAHRGYLAQGFERHFAVYLFEYPGYGAREGKPSEKAFTAAATDAFMQLRRETDGRIFLGGESLGTGVAAHLAGAHPDQVAGLFLITPFDSLVAVARSHYPVFPVGWILRDRYESAKHLETYQGRLAVLLAEHDEVIPARFGQALYDGYDGPKQLWIQTGRSHNTLDYSRGGHWWNEVAAFLKDTSAD